MALKNQIVKQVVLSILGIIFLTLSGCREIPLSPGAGIGENWPLFRGDVSCSGYTKKQLPEKPALKWVFTSEETTLSSPVVYNSIVYWPDREGVVRGIDPDGNLSFQYDLAVTVESIPMIWDSVLYLGRNDGLVTALSIDRREKLWDFKTYGQVLASPNMIEMEEQKLLVIGSLDHVLYFIDSQTGKEVRRYDAHSFIKGTAALWNEYVLFGDADSRLHIVDYRTGVAEDSFLLEGAISSSPAIRGNYCYIGDNSGNIFKFHIEKGKIIRHMKLLNAMDKNTSFVSVPAISSELFIAYADPEHLYAVSRKDGSKPWKYRVKGRGGESAPVICGDKVLFCTRNGVITILDANKGKVLWEYETGEEILGSPAVIKDHFYILTTQGSLLCFGEEV
ncbi:MAG: PQQ-binding-like beta-propeller repeat protein [Tannerellaceae bacterium]|nr:PQQ-binding-like beta-propeller repeat protein [Tannerellaceae bacterium]